MTIRHLRIFTVVAILGLCATQTRAAILYSDNFNTTTDIANWTVNVAPTTTAAQQGAITGFDYSTFGIPAAPGGSDTLGMRLRANVPGTDAAPVTTRPAGSTSGLSVSPAGQDFGTNYIATFYAWSNFNGAANASGLADNANSEGGTNNVMFALGTSGTVPLVVGNTALVTNGQMDGIGFATTGDGGITNDYRIYPKSGTITPAGANYAAGSTANTAAYYQTIFGTHTAPAAQLALSTAEFNDGVNNTQAGSTQAGAFGFAWHKVELIKNGNTAAWAIDGNPIANLDVSSITLGGNNIALGQSDVNSSTTRHPSLLFTVFDNLTVESVPEPASALLLVFGLAGLGWFGRRARG
jgi:hypothetical protein